MANILKTNLKVRVFVLFLAVSVIGVSILGALAYFAGRVIMQDQILRDFQNICCSRETTVMMFLDKSNVRFSLLAKSVSIREYMQKLSRNDPDSQRLLGELIAYMKDRLDGASKDMEYFIVDMSGKIIASTDAKHVGVDRSKDEYFLEGKKGFHIKDVYLSDITDKIGFVISGPLYSDTKELLGVFGIRYGMEALNAITADRTGLGETGEFYIVNNDGVIITELRHKKGVVLKQKSETMPVKLWQAQRKEMNGIYPDYRGQLVLGASGGAELAKQCPGLDWVVLAEIDDDEAYAPIQKLGLAILIIGLVISVIIALIAYLIARGIARPITLIARMVQKVGEGDLTQDIADTKAVDEIGVLSKSFKQTIVSLRSIVSQALSTAERVSSSSQELSSSAQEMNATTEEVASTVQQLAKGAETIARRVEETSRVMEQMNASVGQVAASTRNAAGTAAQASQSALQGGKATKEVVEKMNMIYETVTVSSGVVQKLGERSEQISEIIHVITDIADQTNLLALNAAIEAARAGEAGRGFAVVAEEVRKLAEGSAKAADQIGKLIKEIQKETLEAVKAMQSSSKEVGEGREVILKTSAALLEIIKAAGDGASLLGQISAATQQIASGTQQVVKSVDDIASSAEESASATEEASASTEEMTASMQEMSASAQELAEMAVNLRDVVAKFKVAETGDGSKPAMQPKEGFFAVVKKSALSGKPEADRKRFEELRKKTEPHHPEA